MKKRMIILTAGTLVGISVLTGCSSTPPKPVMTTVTFEQTEEAVPLFRIADRDNPKEVITFARSLSGAGRYDESAKIYLDAAERFKSISGNFEIDCQLAAVREYWLAGSFSQAHKLLDLLEKQQDIYNRAGESEEIRRLRALLQASEAIKQTTPQITSN